MGNRTAALVAVLCLSGCGGREPAVTSPEPAPAALPKGAQVATFGAGCFWCVEAIYSELDGVISVIPGYSGGTVPHPTYEQVCTGKTGHAEVVQITYDPAKVRYEDLLEVFWKTHDPTVTDRQGEDVGAQYRSVVFYHDAKQKELAEHYRKALDASGAYAAPIVTSIVPFREFWPAEAYHRDYYLHHPDQAYCMLVIGPKLEKFRKVFRERLRKTAR
jgi:peptide-methionine (S)-S-oxide reductase